MSQRYLLNFACAVLLLVAQQAALTHAVWHLGKDVPAQVQEDSGSGSHLPGDSERSLQSRFCDLHFAMGSLLSGDCAGQGLSDSLPLGHSLATSTAAWRVAQPLLIPPSRGPPVLL